MEYPTYDQRIARSYLRSYSKPKKPKRTYEELSANFDLQESIRLHMGYHPRDKEETLRQWQMNS